MLIFELSKKNRYAQAQCPVIETDEFTFPSNLLRKAPPDLPAVSELQVVRHYTALSQKNFSIDTHFYPLGSCTMKYNPRGVHRLANLNEFIHHHPLTLEENSQGWMQCLYELQEMLKVITGFEEVCLTPMAGAQGELAGIAMIRAYHQSRKDSARTEIIIPDAAHGTNPATAIQCGFKVREVKTDINGNVDLGMLRSIVGPQTAGIMLTNPSTLGIFDQHISVIADIIHAAGGLLYYDGANLNAILGKVLPCKMGFDVMHINLHKTFATPHGGGGPGSGPIAANETLAPFLPIPRVIKVQQQYQWLTDSPHTIGRLSTFYGNAGILLRAYMYIRLLGPEGLERVAEFATLNANYLAHQLEKIGLTLAYPKKRPSHEFVITLKKEAKEFNISALDVAKRLLDYGFHAPTMYFPLLVPECLLIEPTETESKETLDAFVKAFVEILKEIKNKPELVKQAPHTLPIKRLDEVKAARELVVVELL